MKTEERIYSASGETSNGTVSETHLRHTEGSLGSRAGRFSFGLKTKRQVQEGVDTLRALLCLLAHRHTERCLRSLINLRMPIKDVPDAHPTHPRGPQIHV